MTLLVIAPLVFGAVHTYAYSFIFLLTMVFSLLQAYSNVTRKQNGVLHFHWTGTGLGPLFAGLFLLLVFQMIPIPNPVLLLFSPEGKVAGDMSLYPPGLKGKLACTSTLHLSGPNVPGPLGCVWPHFFRVRPVIGLAKTHRARGYSDCASVLF